MRTIYDFQEALQAVNVKQASEESLNETADIAVQLNREQLSEGTYKSGHYLPDYSYTSVHLYGKPAGPIRLYDMGDFYKGINHVAAGGKINMYSQDWKSDMLEEVYGRAYGEELFGLSRYSRQIYFQDLQPALTDNFARQLRLPSRLPF